MKRVISWDPSIFNQSWDENEEKEKQINDYFNNPAKYNFFEQTFIDQQVKQDNFQGKVVNSLIPN